MRYITRELYKSMQGGSGLSADEADRRWHEACDAYRAELCAEKARLPESMQKFSEVTLHDGRVLWAARPRSDLVEIEVDATSNPWGPRGRYRVAFRGVKEVEGLAEINSDEWLYEEVHSHPSAGFEYCVLLCRSEFKIVADEVSFEETAVT